MVRLARAGAADDARASCRPGPRNDTSSRTVRPRRRRTRGRALRARRRTAAGAGSVAAHDLGHGVEDRPRGARSRRARAAIDGDDEAERDASARSRRWSAPARTRRSRPGVISPREHEAARRTRRRRGCRSALMRPHHRAHRAAEPREGEALLEVVAVDLSKRRELDVLEREARTTRTPARLACTRSLILPSASWFVAGEREHLLGERAGDQDQQRAASRARRA